jgi:hypothetical protein
MQLADVDVSNIIRPTDFLFTGKSMALFIDNPPADDAFFKDDWERRKKFFPKLTTAFDESEKPLSQRSIEERVYLKEKLLEDMRTNVAAVKAELDGDKRLGSEEFPSDPDESIQFLDAKEDSLCKQMEKIKSTLQELSRARAVLKHIQKMKSYLLTQYDESFYMSMPQHLPAVQPSNPKKAKNS